MRTCLLLSVTALLLLSGAFPASAQLFGRRGRGTPWSVYGYMSAGVREADIDELNDQLAAAGYGEFSTRFLSVSGGMNISVRRLVFGWEGAALLTDGESSADGTISSELAGGEGLFTVGYKIISTRGFSLYPLVGFGGGAMQLSLLPATGVTFGTVLADPRRMSRISAATALANLGIGAEYLVPVVRFWGTEGGVLLGLRAGYVFSTVSSNWRFENTAIPGGPDLDLSGAYIRGMFGFGIHSLSEIRR